jgi:uncharacterized protein YjiS (DUF1127 family)
MRKLSYHARDLRRGDGFRHNRASARKLPRYPQPTSAGAAMPSTKRLVRPAQYFLHLMHVVIARRLRAAAQPRELARLSDRQLRDAGIDPTLAGRGKAVAVDRTTLLRLPPYS